jgi:hypothetical protein
VQEIRMIKYIGKILDFLIKKTQIDPEKLSKSIRKIRNTVLLLLVVLASIYFIKNENTRIWGIIIFLLSFAFLYSYVVKRRGTKKK